MGKYPTVTPTASRVALILLLPFYTYTSNGQMASTIMNDSLRYEYLYDSLSRLVRSSRRDNGSLVLETRQEYDTSNRLSKQYINLVDKLHTEEYNYDSHGRLSTVTDETGDSYTLGYSSLNMLETVTNSVYQKKYSCTRIWWHYNNNIGW